MPHQEPPENKLVRFQCADCGKRLSAKYSSIGASFTCPECGAAVKVPLPAVPIFGPNDNDVPAAHARPIAPHQDDDEEEDRGFLFGIGKTFSGFKRKRELKQELAKVQDSMVPFKLRLDSARLTLGQSLWQISDVQQLELPVVQDLKSLEATLAGIDAKLNEASVEIQSIAAKLEQQIEEWERAHAPLVADRDEAEARLKDATAARDELTSQYEAVYAELQGKLQTPRELITKVGAMGKATLIGEAEEVVGQMRQSFDEINQSLEPWFARLTEIHEQLVVSERAVRDAQAELQEINSRIREHTQQRSDVERAAADEKKSQLGRMSELTRDQSDVKSKKQESLSTLANVIREESPALAQQCKENQEMQEALNYIETAKKSIREMESELYQLENR